jgi:2-dehydropantoate 2-reductase
MSKKIAVLGTGANGSCAAADLSKAGCDVVLIDQWPEHVEAMRANGLRVNMSDRKLHVPVRAYHLCDVCALNQTFDVVLLAMKAYDARWACEFIKPYLAPDGLLVGLQNAMTAELIAEVVGPSHTIGCVVELSSELFTPGVVQRNTPPEKTWFGLGSLDPSMDGRVAEIEELLRNVGSVSITPNVLAAKWMKLVVNTMCLGPFAIVGLSMADAVRLPGMRELFLRIGQEALDVGQAPRVRHRADFRAQARRYPGRQSAAGKAVRQAGERHRRPQPSQLRSAGHPQGALQRGRPDQRPGGRGEQAARQIGAGQCHGGRAHAPDSRRRSQARSIQHGAGPRNARQRPTGMTRIRGARRMTPTRFHPSRSRFPPGRSATSP